MFLSLDPGSSSRALASLNFGPEISLSVPQALQLGVEGYCTEGAFFCDKAAREYLDLGGVLYPIGASDKALSIFNVETGVRYFIHDSRFFTGLSLGFRNIAIHADLSAFRIEGATLATSAAVSFSTIYMGPLFGFKFDLENEFFLETSIGVQVSLYASGFMFLRNSKSGLSSNNSTILQVDSNTAMSRIAGLLLPTITLVRLVRYF